MIVLVRNLTTSKILSRKCDQVNNNNGGFITLYHRQRVSPHGYKYWSEHLSHDQFSFVARIVETSTDKQDHLATADQG